MSLLFYVQNKHSWTTGDLFSQCEHPELTKKQIKSKEWPSPNSYAFMVLQDIVTSKSALNDLKHLTQLLHTVTLEIYHALYNFIMSCQGKVFLMKITYSIIIAMVVKQPCKGSVVELRIEKRIDQFFVLSMVSPNYYLSHIKFPHAPQS